MSKRRFKKNPILLLLITFFLLVTGCLTVVSGNLAYRIKKAEFFSEIEERLDSVYEGYSGIIEEHWKTYFAILNDVEIRNVLNWYFLEPQDDVPPLMRNRLRNTLGLVTSQNERIQWIALYSEQKKQNYVYIKRSNKAIIIPENFVYYEELRSRESMREIYCQKRIELDGYEFDTLAIAGCGFMQNPSNHSSILVGYDAGFITKDLFERKKSDVVGQRYFALWEDRNIIGTDTDEDWDCSGLTAVKESGRCFLDGTSYYVQLSERNLQGLTIGCLIKWNDFILYTNRWSIAICGILLIIMVFAVLVYFGILRVFKREVDSILEGLQYLSDNQLDYRISSKFFQPELEDIADGINRMSYKLKENLEHVIQFEKLQAKVQFSELQAKFNPHFLYNVLEIFRDRCYQNGDEETATMIAETATLFRGFIGSSDTVLISEELSYCRRYLSIYHARYEDSVKVLFDIDDEVLDYRIIRNVFQPLVENYFEHGYNSQRMDNYILIQGCVTNEENILFTVVDNGRGMEEESYQKLVSDIQNTNLSETKSYGLRNLNQRIRYYYGESYGISIFRNEESGMRIEVLIKCQR